MSFQYSAIGDNTPENRDHLEKIGFTMSMVTMDKALYLKTQTNGKYYETNKDDWSKVIINCIGNPALFKAVTSMRDDSDKWQFFVHEDGSFVFCDQGELKHVIDNEYMYQEYAVSEFHKATLSELQAHFKRV
ncbi:MAG: hypothetical protein KIC84_11565 [Dysgonomonas mossii]|uniref:hypothetical protein n=1 Tax=Dysgonomonas mossii TaxID=163665 RepID=UPI0026F14D83|nr:hypothetical protein [Dysgonomonas mossii]MBS5907852.1 hypothetical protein [Dysgonomonas mossii]